MDAASPRLNRLSAAWAADSLGELTPRDGLVEGRGLGGRVVRVVYVLDEDGTAFVIHTMPLTTRRRRR